MKAGNNDLVKLSDPGTVSDYLKSIKHPLAEVIEALRQIILRTDKVIGEEIRWNAPTFFYIGEMKPFNPKEYRRHLIVFNLFKKDCIKLVFTSGAKVNDTSGLLEGDYADGRRLAMFYNMKDVKTKENHCKKLLKTG